MITVLGIELLSVSISVKYLYDFAEIVQREAVLGQPGCRQHLDLFLGTCILSLPGRVCLSVEEVGEEGRADDGEYATELPQLLI